MIDTSITRKLIEDGEVKKCAILFEGRLINCTILKIFLMDGIGCVKLKPSKKYPLGHEHIVRTINELY